ncbi:MAG TPA: methylated-DNA--[protein]-cysteine S-methyltransferase [Chloroflexota bacterium]|nr:methylated-DNA--[protein]-cysteine S-methyltransferase [Chloroflexota bacterium]
MTIEEMLAEMRQVTAPADLLPAVMRRVLPADAYFPLESPLGTVYVAYNQRGVTRVSLAASPEEFETRYRAETGRRALPAEDAALQAAVRAHLAGQESTVPFDLDRVTPFEREVLHTALRIPRGQVRPYNWIAREMGRPGASRAVGTALAHNPIPLLIPCHRVVRADGTIGQYSLGGPDAKRRLLQWEGALFA